MPEKQKKSKVESRKSSQRSTELLHPELSIQDGFIVHQQGDEKRKIGREIIIPEKMKDIDTNDVSLLLRFRDDNDTFQEIKISRGELRKTRLVELLAKGADVFDHNVTMVIKHLRNQEELAEQTFVHHQLGWGTYKGNPIFKHAEAIGVASHYQGDLTLGPKGSFEKWKSMVQEHVMGNTPLELAILLGLSAAIVGYIGSTTALDTLFFHIYGDSTQGKTTATSLAISTFGYPGTSKDGLMKSWQMTENALINSFSGNFGVPVALDEASMANIQEFSSTIYRIAGNRDKARMDKNAILKPTGKWCTTVLSNGEFSLTTKGAQNSGIRMRVIEIGHVQWTKDAKSADFIKQTVLDNYGHAGLLFAQKLRRFKRDSIIKCWETWSKKFCTSSTHKTKFTDRLSRKLALIMLTCAVAKKALDLEFNTQEIFQFLLDNEAAQVETRDLGERALEYFQEQYLKHSNHFLSDSNPYARQDTYGKVTESEGGTTVSILTTEFAKWMKEGGFEDCKIVLKNWKDKKILDSEKDRYTRKQKVGPSQVKVTVYCIKLNTNENNPEVLS
ncbi:DUF927 domain-containing protein [Paenibacillus sp. EKM208P]|nr:DUF927 domain-containing protein [Paenibacillus sp. EKM208P]